MGGFLINHGTPSTLTEGLATKDYVNNKTSEIENNTIPQAFSQHNVDTSAHNDIRIRLSELAIRLNTLADSDDETLNQLSEIVAYIKSNKELIDAVTTSKVNVLDIIDNLITNVSDKPLSSAQGVTLKTMIDKKQNTITGTPGQFVVIGENGKITTKDVAVVGEVAY